MAKVALLIGVSEYEVGLHPLPAAAKDVVALERILKDSEMGDFDDVKILTNPEPQAMQYEVETLFSGRSKDDFVLLFFSGHGIKDDNNNLYFATRITKKSAKGDLIRSTAVPARFVHEVMNNSRAKRQAIILDCCFSGAFDPSLPTKDDGSVDLQRELGSEGRVVLTSSSSTQYSFEQQGSDLSLYTRYLIEGIETGAGDRNEDGKISMLELHDYATSRVQETAPSMTPKLITLKDLGFDLVLAKAKVTDPKLRYRRLVEKYSSRGSISSAGRMILNTQQKQLGLPVEVVKEIETEVLRPYQERLENLQRYKDEFSKAVKNEYPLSRHAQSELEDLLDVWGLRREDVDAIEQEIIAQSAQSSAAAREEYQQKLQRYEQDFRRAIEAAYPLNSNVRNGLNDFQQSLGLRSEDVEQIERPILAQKYQQSLEIEQLRQKQEQEKLKQEQEKLKQEQEKLEYQRNLQRYEHEFRRAIDAEYPLGYYAIDALRKFRNSLILKDEDIRRIETSVSQAKEAEYQKQQAAKLRQQQESERLQQELESERLRDQQRRQENEEYRRKLLQQEEETRTRQTQVVKNSKVSSTLRYGGFWRRSFAFLVDALISFGVFYGTGELVYRVSGNSVGAWNTAIFGFLLYYVLFEISPLKATIGKLMTGLQVTNMYGKKLSFFKSLFRLIFKTALIACFGIGILQLLVSLLNTEKKQGIHDLMMGTVVVLKDEEN